MFEIENYYEYRPLLQHNYSIILLKSFKLDVLVKQISKLSKHIKRSTDETYTTYSYYSVIIKDNDSPQRAIQMELGI